MSRALKNRALSKRLRELSGNAREVAEAREAEKRKKLEQRDDNIREAERRRRAKGEYERTMDARDKVAKQVADNAGMSFPDAQRAVTNAMQQSRRRRG